jgi:hypothetical protein
MAPRHVRPLEPELVGGLFGRSGSVVAGSFLRRTAPKVRFLLLGLGGLLTLLVLGGAQRALVGDPGTTAAIGLVFGTGHPARTVTLGFLQDPVGIVDVLVSLATPIFCAEQIDAIRAFVPANLRNLRHSNRTLDEAALNAVIARANRQFAIIGSRTVSVLLFAACVTVTIEIYALFPRGGVLASWLGPRINGRPAAAVVYDGWWANASRHTLLAVALCVITVYLFYFLAKQIAMGVVFALFATRAAALDFGAIQDLRINSDGYWGLRNLRHFMMWTYGSTLSHFVATLGVFVIWLPFGQWTIMLIVVVMIVNCVVVIYPSVVAYKSSVAEKTAFANEVLASAATQKEKDTLVEKMWNRPHLPFRTASTFTAAFVYVLAPLSLALVSSLLKH